MFALPSLCCPGSAGLPRSRAGTPADLGYTGGAASPSADPPVRPRPRNPSSAPSRPASGWAGDQPGRVERVSSAASAARSADDSASTQCQSSEGRILAVSSMSRPTSRSTKRVSFAKLREPLEVPNLLALQTDSFDWLVGGPGLARPADRADARAAWTRSSRRSRRSRTSPATCRCPSPTRVSTRSRRTRRSAGTRT